MRKIISILVTLGVILGMTAFAAPVAAAPCTCPATMGTFSIATAPFCAGTSQNYLIGTVTNFILPVTLIAGTDFLSVDFPAGTDLSSVLFGGVSIDGSPLTAASQLVVSGTHLEARIPVALIGSMNAATGHFMQVNGVKNTATVDTHCLYVGYKQPCCAGVQFACKTFAVVPAIATLGFHVDFEKTYTGIAADFVPPFKACGQEGYGVYVDQVGWMNIFDLILMADVAGCQPPCGNATMWFKLTKCPTGETVTFVFDTLGINSTFTLGVADIGLVKALPNVLMPAGLPTTWENWLHFSSPGDYEICFYLECPAVPCLAGAQIVAQKCIPFKVHQWKDSGKIILDEKWNLISLPLVPFDGTLSVLQQSLTPEALADWVSIWYYRPPWETPTSLVDGRSYWVRMDYPLAGSYNWWVFGTAKPMPPAAPSAYPMTAAAWNMFGFTSLIAMDSGANGVGYLWNFGTSPLPVSPLVYGWDNTGDWTTSGWNIITLPLEDLLSGQGYWGYFPTGGIVVPP